MWNLCHSTRPHDFWASSRLEHRPAGPWARPLEGWRFALTGTKHLDICRLQVIRSTPDGPGKKKRGSRDRSSVHSACSTPLNRMWTHWWAGENKGKYRTN